MLSRPALISTPSQTNWRCNTMAIEIYCGSARRRPSQATWRIGDNEEWRPATNGRCASVCGACKYRYWCNFQRTD